MSEETIFVDGFRAFKPSEKAPDFIKANIVLDMKALRDFALDHHKEGELKVIIKESKGGKYYAALDTFVPKPQGQPADSNDFDADAPF